MKKYNLKIKISSIYLVLLSVILIYSTSTFLRLQYNFYLAVFLYAAFFLLTYANHFKWRIMKGTMTAWFGIALLTSLVFFLNHVHPKIWIVYISSYIHIFFWTEAFLFLIYNYDKSTIKKFTIINIVFILICVAATIRALHLYPLAARSMYGHAEGIEDSAFLHKMGCGGFGFVYGCIYLMLAALLGVRGAKVSTNMKVFRLCSVALMLYMIIISGFTMAFLITAVGIILDYIYANNKHKFLGFVGVLAFATVLFVYKRDIVDLIGQLGTLIGADMLTEKMGKIAYAIDSQNMMLLARFRVYARSIQGFLQHPIWGSGRAGMDSQILSIFSLIGLFGIGYIGLLISTFRTMSHYIKKECVLVMAVLVFILATFNPFNDMTLMSCVFFLAPTILYLTQSTTANSEVL